MEDSKIGLDPNSSYYDEGGISVMDVIKAKLTISSKSHGKVPGLNLNLLDLISAPIHIRLRILRVVADNGLLFQLKLHAAYIQSDFNTDLLTF